MQKIVLIVLASVVSACSGQAYLEDIHKQVAADAVTQYQITSRSGSAMDKCVQAGLVAAAFLQAKDEPYYKGWKERETADCKAVGVER